MSTQPCTTAVSAGNDVIVIWLPGAPSLSSLISEPVDPYEPARRHPVCPGWRASSSLPRDANGDPRLPSPEESEPDGDAYRLHCADEASVPDSAAGTENSVMAAAPSASLTACFRLKWPESTQSGLCRIQFGPGARWAPRRVS